MSVLFASSLDMMARMPKQVFMASAWLEFKSIRLRMSGTRFTGNTDMVYTIRIYLFASSIGVCLNQPLPVEPRDISDASYLHECLDCGQTDCSRRAD
jgi:hypothetical protein